MKPLNLIILGVIVALAEVVPMRTLAQQSLTPDSKSWLNCLPEYPQTPAQGEQPITRYQFAAGLDACLNEVVQSLEPENFAKKTDLNQLTKRQQELNQELRQLRDRVDKL